MKRFLPRSLLGQMMLLIGAALLVAQMVNFALILSDRQRLSLAQTEAPAVAHFVHTAAQARSNGGFAVPARGGRGAAYAVGGKSLIDQAGLPRTPALEARLRAALAEAGIEARQVRAARSTDFRRFRPGGGEGRPPRRAGGERQILLLAAELGDGVWLNGRIVAPRGDPWLPYRLLGATIALYILVLAAAFWIARRLARPLQDLTHAAEAFEGRSAAEHVEPRGPADVRRAVDAFNAMNRRVSTLLDEKDRMLAAIGHDLRTPLASIRIRAENMEPAAERERLVAIVEEMHATLEDILVLARTGRPRETLRRIDIGALADALVEEYRDRGENVTFDGEAGAVANVQPNLLRRAVRNLIDNALAYGTRATVRAVPGKDAVIVEVEDDGPGIPEDRIGEVVEPFRRLEASRSRETGGAGLGLAIVQAIASAHGGTLRLRNRGGGLTASITLPTAGLPG
ncbi:MAG: ATP-binding protein [Allosphingosinicella sp.]